MVFTLNGCSHCEHLVNKLTELGIIHQNLEINQNKTLWDHVVSETGYNILPTVILKDDDSDLGVVYIPGKDFQNTEEIVELIIQHI